eukprot:4071200-Pleurochrysis_carterae.AAC.1
MKRAAGFRSQPPDHSPKSDSRSSRYRALAITYAVGSRRRVGRSRQTDIRANAACTLKKLKVYVADVEATPSRSEAG